MYTEAIRANGFIFIVALLNYVRCNWNIIMWPVIVQVLLMRHNRMCMTMNAEAFL